MTVSKGRLFGISHTNREGEDLWGKNQFNSTFPLSLVCLMREKNIPVVYIKLKEDLTTERVELPIDELFNTTLPNSELYFDFESCFTPYAKFHYGDLERVDLVISEKKEETKKDKTKIVAGKPLRALETKLTVVPDSTTCEKEPELWAPEIVVRPATTMYCALGMAYSPDISQKDVEEIFLPVGKHVVNWGNETEALKILPHALAALDQFQKKFYSTQQPLILQPIWRTQGRKSLLDENAFDVFVWSDFALPRVYIELAKASLGGKKITRHARSALRLSRYLYEYGRAGAANIDTIYSDMTYSYQSDKEFALSGMTTQPYMAHPRLIKPIMHRDTVKEIILEGGEKNLAPERRFDQTIYFTYNFEATSEDPK